MTRPRRERSSQRGNEGRPQPLCVHLPDGERVELQRDEAVAVHGKLYGGDDGGTGCSVDPSSDCSYLMDVGGLVWTMAWGPSCDTRFLAVGKHRSPTIEHTIGDDTICGDNSIQIWEFPGEDSGDGEGQRGCPVLSVNVEHRGGVTWSCDWCPAPNVSTDDRLGLLASALGDGSVCVWSVPHPRGWLHMAERENMLHGRPKPAAWFCSKHLDSSLPSTVQWLPGEPYDLLLVGCWDGYVCIAKMIDKQEEIGKSNVDGWKNAGSSLPSPHNIEFLYYFPTDQLPLRAASWMPNIPKLQAPFDSSNRYMFSTVGHEGALTIWDARCATRAWATSYMYTNFIVAFLLPQRRI